MNRRTCLFAALVALTTANTLHAGFVVSSLQLDNGVVTDDEIEFDRITTISNPLNQDSLAQIGANIVESTYAFQWDASLGTGDFNTDIAHTMRSIDVSTITRVVVFIEPTEDLRVTVDGAISYAHTPGDETSLLFGMSVRNFETSGYAFRMTLEGGNGDLRPASDTLAIHGEGVIATGTLYRLQVVLDNSNFAFPNDTGILDATGHANFRIEPLVPEPQTAMLLAFAAATLIPRRRSPRRRSP